MTGHQKYSGDKGTSSAGRKKTAEQEVGDAGKDSCRCKEVSKKTIPQMLKLMLSDLAFWKKGH